MGFFYWIVIGLGVLGGSWPFAAPGLFTGTRPIVAASVGAIILDRTTRVPKRT